MNTGISAPSGATESAAQDFVLIEKRAFDDILDLLDAVRRHLKLNADVAYANTINADILDTKASEEFIEASRALNGANDIQFTFDRVLIKGVSYPRSGTSVRVEGSLGPARVFITSDNAKAVENAVTAIEEWQDDANQLDDQAKHDAGNSAGDYTFADGDDEVEARAWRRLQQRDGLAAKAGRGELS